MIQSKTVKQLFLFNFLNFPCKTLHSWSFGQHSLFKNFSEYFFCCLWCHQTFCKKFSNFSLTCSTVIVTCLKQVLLQIKTCKTDSFIFSKCYGASIISKWQSWNLFLTGLVYFNNWWHKLFCNWTRERNNPGLNPQTNFYAIYVSPLYNLLKITTLAAGNFVKWWNINMEALINSMKKEVHRRNKWLKDLGMKVNESKMEICVVHRLDTPQFHLTLIEVKISSVNLMNVIGLQFGSKLSWSSKISKCVKKLNQHYRQYS
jgi:hypothetical protein